MAASFIQELGVPEEKAKFTFKRPESIEIIGSCAVKTMVMPKQTIDLAVQMPKVLVLYSSLFSCLFKEKGIPSHIDI